MAAFPHYVWAAVVKATSKTVQYSEHWVVLHWSECRTVHSETRAAGSYCTLRSLSPPARCEWGRPAGDKLRWGEIKDVISTQ